MFAFLFREFSCKEQTKEDVEGEAGMQVREKVTESEGKGRYSKWREKVDWKMRRKCDTVMRKGGGWGSG